MFSGPRNRSLKLRDERVTVRQMLDTCRKVRELTEGRARETLDSDWVAAFALMRALEILGEGARRISAEFRGSHPQIPWSQIVGLRDRLIHGYDQVDLDRLWKIANDDIPALISGLEAILGIGRA